MKQGTPSMPASLAEFASASTSATSSSVASLRAHLVAIEAAVDRRLHQNLAVGQIAAFAEIKLHQPLFHRPPPLPPAQWISRWQSSVLGWRLILSRA